METALRYRIDFDELAWETPIIGVRHKCLHQDGLCMRLVEYSPEMPPHWCEKGHYGYLLEGQMDIEYEAATVSYQAGDGIFIPSGPQHRHRATVSSGRALVFFVEPV